MRAFVLLTLRKMADEVRHFFDVAEKLTLEAGKVSKIVRKDNFFPNVLTRLINCATETDKIAIKNVTAIKEHDAKSDFLTFHARASRVRDIQRKQSLL